MGRKRSMEYWDRLVSKWRKSWASGHRTPVSRFIVANIDSKCCRSMRVPYAVHKEFSDSFPYYLGLMCNKDLWRVKYDAKKRRIYKIRSLMKNLKISLFDVLQVNYYGKGLFKLRVFRSTGNECYYPKNNQIHKWDKDKTVYEDRVLDYNSVAFEKNLSVLWYNAIGRVDFSYEMKIRGLCTQRNIMNLKLLDEEMEPFYRNWNTSDKVFFQFTKRQWEIEVIWTVEGCNFGNGWMQFASETNLVEGDILIIYKKNKCETHNLNVSIFKGREEDDETVETSGSGRRYSHNLLGKTEFITYKLM